MSTLILGLSALVLGVLSWFLRDRTRVCYRLSAFATILGAMFLLSFGYVPSLALVLAIIPATMAGMFVTERFGYVINGWGYSLSVLTFTALSWILIAVILF